MKRRNKNLTNLSDKTKSWWLRFVRGMNFQVKFLRLKSLNYFCSIKLIIAIFQNLSLYFQIYIHEPGTEYWIQKFRFPGKVQIIDFDTDEPDSMSMMVYAVGSLKYIVDQKLNRENHKCNSSATMESFTKCVFSRFKHTECTAIITKIGNDDLYLEGRGSNLGATR